MSNNLILYPLDYPQASAGGSGSAGSAQDSTSISTVEGTLQQIDKEALDTAIKDALSRRIEGQGNIDTQDRLLSTVYGIMPLYVVTPTPQGIPFLGTQGIPFLGTKGITGGGKGYDGSSSYGIWATMSRFTYSGESIATLATRLSSARVYMATVSDASGGKFLGGVAQGGVYNTIDKVSYLDERVIKLSATLSQLIFGAAGGIGTKTLGYLLGGSTGTYFLKSGYRYNHSLDSVSYLGEITTVPRLSAHNGAGNRYNGYIFAGTGVRGNLTNYFTWTDVAYHLFSIERLTYSNEVVSALGTTLTASHVSHAIFGNETKSYIAGGAMSAGNQVLWATTTIEAFTFGGETSSVLSSGLQDAKICVDGVSSQIAGYAIGGDTLTGWSGSKSIDKLLFSSEITSRIGASLSSYLNDQGGVSDYSPGFSY